MRPSEAYMRQYYVIIGSENGLSTDRRQAIIWTDVGKWLIGLL